MAIKNIVELSEHKQGNWLLDLVEKLRAKGYTVERVCNGCSTDKSP